MSNNIVEFKKKTKPMNSQLKVDIFIFILWLTTGIITLIYGPNRISYACILSTYLLRKIIDILNDIEL